LRPVRDLRRALSADRTLFAFHRHAKDELLTGSPWVKIETRKDAGMAGARLTRATRRDEGAAAVEFALLFPLFLAIVFGIINFGFAFNQKINLTQAAREASRYGATLSLKASHKTGVLADGTVDTWLAKVQQVALSAGGDDLKAGRSGRYLCVAYVSAAQTKSLTIGSGGPASSAKCYDDGRDDDRVQVVLRSDTALDVLLFGGTITVGSTSTTHFEAAPPS
jgi:Flp pilus assembly protein TadG